MLQMCHSTDVGSMPAADSRSVALAERGTSVENRTNNDDDELTVRVSFGLIDGTH